MGQCYKCKEFFGPDYLIIYGENPVLTCVFCMYGKNKIEVEKDHQKYYVTKQECINKYKEFIGRMARSEEIKKKVLKEQISGK